VNSVMDAAAAAVASKRELLAISPSIDSADHSQAPPVVLATPPSGYALNSKSYAMAAGNFTAADELYYARLQCGHRSRGNQFTKFKVNGYELEEATTICKKCDVKGHNYRCKNAAFLWYYIESMNKQNPGLYVLPNNLEFDDDDNILWDRIFRNRNNNFPQEWKNRIQERRAREVEADSKVQLQSGSEGDDGKYESDVPREQLTKEKPGDVRIAGIKCSYDAQDMLEKDWTRIQNIALANCNVNNNSGIGSVQEIPSGYMPPKLERQNADVHFVPSNSPNELSSGFLQPLRPQSDLTMKENAKIARRSRDGRGRDCDCCCVHGCIKCKWTHKTVRLNDGKEMPVEVSAKLEFINSYMRDQPEMVEKALKEEPELKTWYDYLYSKFIPAETYQGSLLSTIDKLDEYANVGLTMLKLLYFDDRNNTQESSGGSLLGKRYVIVFPCFLVVTNRKLGADVMQMPDMILAISYGTVRMNVLLLGYLLR